MAISSTRPAPTYLGLKIVSRVFYVLSIVTFIAAIALPMSLYKAVQDRLAFFRPADAYEAPLAWKGLVTYVVIGVMIALYALLMLTAGLVTSWMVDQGKNGHQVREATMRMAERTSPRAGGAIDLQGHLQR